MFFEHGQDFAFMLQEIGGVDPNIVEPMIIFTIPHISWSFRPMLVHRTHVTLLIKLL